MTEQTDEYQEWQTPANGFDLSDAPTECAPMVRWIWSGTCSENALLHQLHGVKDLGYYGAVIQLAADNIWGGYSRDYFSRVSTVAAEADRIGVHFWLHFPSPAVLFPPAKPQNRCLKLHEWENSPGRWKKVRLSEPVLRATAFPMQSHRLGMEKGGAIDVTKAVRDFRTPEGLQGTWPYRVCAVTESQLSPTENGEMDFFASSLDSVKLILEDFLGNVITGVVCEVRLPRHRRETPRWCDDLALRFVRDHRYELPTVIDSLFYDTGQSSSRVRQDYWSTWTQLYIEEHWQALAQWCVASGIRLYGQRESGNDPLSLLDNLTGVASLAGTLDGWVYPAAYNTDEDLPFLRLCSSLARQHGKSLVIDMTSTSTPWNRLISSCAEEETERWITHALADSPSTGRREAASRGRWLFPLPSFRCESEAKYFRYLSHAVISSRSVKQVAIILPTRSAWERPLAAGEDDLQQSLCADFAFIFRTLQEMHFNFDVTCEWDFVHASIADGSIQIGSQSYQMIVLPSMTALSRFAWAKLMDFVRHGGSVASFGLLPCRSEMGEDEDFVKQIEEDCRVDVMNLHRLYSGGDEDRQEQEFYPVYCEDVSGGRFCSYQPTLCNDPEDARLRIHQIFRESINPEFESQNHNIRYQRRVQSCENDVFSHHLLLVANVGAEPAAPRVQVGITGSVSAVDLMGGRSRREWEYSWLNDRQMSVPLKLATRETRLIMVHESWIETHVDTTNFQVDDVQSVDSRVEVTGHASKSVTETYAFVDTGADTIELRGGRLGAPEEQALATSWTRQNASAWLPLTHWEYRLGGMSRSLFERLLDRSDREWIDWAAEKALTVADARRDDFSLVLRTRFTVRKLGQPLLLYAEPLPGESRYFLNREPLDLPLASRWGWEWNHASLDGRLRNGANELAIEISIGKEESPHPRRLPGVLGLYGSFACDSELAAIFPFQPELPITEGEPLQPGALSLPDELDLVADLPVSKEMFGRHLTVKLALTEGYAQLTVNGMALPFQPFPPYQADITPVIVSGNNQLRLKLQVSDMESFLGEGKRAFVFGPNQLTVSPSIRLHKELPPPQAD